MNTKTLSFLFSVLLFTSVVHAQVQQGSTLIGGQLSFSTNTADIPENQSHTNNKTGSFQLRIGKAFRENSASGISIGLSTYKNATEHPVNNELVNVIRKGNTFYAGAFHRKYKPLGNDFYFFGELGAGYTFSNTTYIPEEQKSKAHTVSAQATPGLSYQVLKKAHIELLLPGIANITYHSSRSDEQRNNKTRAFSFSSSLQHNPLESLAVGFSLFL